MDGRIRHRSIIGLGKLDGLSEEQIKLLGKRIEQLLTNQLDCFLLKKDDPTVEKLAQYYFTEIKKKTRYDTVQEPSDWKPSI